MRKSDYNQITRPSALAADASVRLRAAFMTRVDAHARGPRQV